MLGKPKALLRNSKERNKKEGSTINRQSKKKVPWWGRDPQIKRTSAERVERVRSLLLNVKKRIKLGYVRLTKCSDQ